MLRNKASAYMRMARVKKWNGEERAHDMFLPLCWELTGF